MNEPMDFPRPTAEHVELTKHAGTWKVHSTFSMDPDPSAPPIERLGEFRTTSVHASDLVGLP